MSGDRRCLQIVSLIVIASVVLLLPAHGREKARIASCQSQLRLLGQALMAYVRQNDGCLPPSRDWQQSITHNIVDLVRDELRSRVEPGRFFVCPSRLHPPLPHYSMVDSLSCIRLNTVKDPSHTVLIYEGHGGFARSGHYGLERTTNLLFADGHTKMALDVTPYGLKEQPMNSGEFSVRAIAEAKERWADLIYNDAGYLYLVVVVMPAIFAALAIRGWRRSDRDRKARLKK